MITVLIYTPYKLCTLLNKKDPIKWFLFFFSSTAKKICSGSYRTQTIQDTGRFPRYVTTSGILDNRIILEILSISVRGRNKFLYSGEREMPSTLFSGAISTAPLRCLF